MHIFMKEKREALGLTQAQFACVLCATEEEVVAWESGAVPVPRVVDMVVRFIGTPDEGAALLISPGLEPGLIGLVNGALRWKSKADDAAREKSSAPATSGGRTPNGSGMTRAKRDHKSVFMKAHRKALGLTQAELARILCATEAEIDAWERGTVPVPKLVNMVVHLLGTENEGAALVVSPGAGPGEFFFINGALLWKLKAGRTPP